MTINAQTQAGVRFDAESYARAFDTWDIATLLAHYADDVELTMVTPDNPPVTRSPTAARSRCG